MWDTTFLHAIRHQSLRVINSQNRQNSQNSQNVMTSHKLQRHPQLKGAKM